MALFMGIQASGKTSFYYVYFQQGYEHINLDTLHTRNKERLAIENCIRLAKNFVIDNTNPKKADRERYIKMAKESGYYITGYFFKSVIKECINRNEQRTGKAKVPRCAIASTSNQLELPEYKEGFDKLYYVCLEEGEFKIEKWREEYEV